MSKIEITVGVILLGKISPSSDLFRELGIETDFVAAHLGTGPKGGHALGIVQALSLIKWKARTRKALGQTPSKSSEKNASQRRPAPREKAGNIKPISETDQDACWSRSLAL